MITAAVDYTAILPSRYHRVTAINHLTPGISHAWSPFTGRRHRTRCSHFCWSPIDRAVPVTPLSCLSLRRRVASGHSSHVVPALSSLSRLLARHPSRRRINNVSKIIVRICCGRNSQQQDKLDQPARTFRRLRPSAPSAGPDRLRHPQLSRNLPRRFAQHGHGRAQLWAGLD